MYVCAYIYFYAYACLHDNLLQSHLTLRLWTVACQAPLSMAFSRQEYWSGLPCPPPENLPNPGIEPRSPTLQADSLLSEPPEKPKDTGIGSLSLLQGICPTQQSNRGLLHCRRTLYQLSSQGSHWPFLVSHFSSPSQSKFPRACTHEPALSLAISG